MVADSQQESHVCVAAAEQQAEGDYRAEAPPAAGGAGRGAGSAGTVGPSCHTRPSMNTQACP
eukprot:COSAG02_NODE_7685_length_2895_cov_3.989628_3_plen_62_part_00